MHFFFVRGCEERDDKVQFSVITLKIVMNKNILTNIQQQHCENLFLGHMCIKDTV
jgi:hypothetical protein